MTMRSLTQYLASDASLSAMLRDYARDNDLSASDIAYFRQDEILMPFITLLHRVRSASR